MVSEFLRYAVPSSLAMFISSLYTVIDGIFVGQGVGDSALAAVNILLLIIEYVPPNKYPTRSSSNSPIEPQFKAPIITNTNEICFNNIFNDK